ncbi:MAG: hypothetical protein JW854_07550 [Actinobacteria bacterium]|nr:hypothetical protein [Actinomycetota bacterium]
MLPYIISIIVGITIFAFKPTDADYRVLFINVATAFLVIPLVFLFYELSQKFIHRNLSRNIFNYCKLQVDREVMSLIQHLGKAVFPYEHKLKSSDMMISFIGLDAESIFEVVAREEYLGFQVMKDFDCFEAAFNKILNNSAILKQLTDEQIISIINILMNLTEWTVWMKRSFPFNKTKDPDPKYKVASGSEISPMNKELSERMLLLRKLDGGKYEVEDFGDFYNPNRDSLLFRFRIDPEKTLGYSQHINYIIRGINSWINSTGRALLIDSKLFRIPSKPD